MINQLNLSSRPFRNRTLPWLLAAVLAGVSLFGFLFLFAELNSVRVKSQAADDSVRQFEDKVKELEKRSDEIKQNLSSEQLKTLQAAHDLVARKRFSWSRLLADLESVLPSNVIVSNVTVRDVYNSGDRMVADLEFAVMAKSYESVMAMVNDMGASGKFQAELRGQDLQRDKGGLTEYSMRLIYLPSYGVPAAAPTTDDRGVNTAQNQISTEAR